MIKIPAYIILLFLAAAPARADQNIIVTDEVEAQPIDPTGTDDAQQDSPQVSDLGNVTSEDIPWNDVPNLSCTGAVDNVINNLSFPISEGNYTRGKMGEIADKLRIYHSFGVKQGLLVYDVKLENDMSRQGRTICSCAEFQDGAMGNFPIAAIGGSWGMNPRKHRSDRKSISIPKQLTSFVTTVNITAGYCPTGRLKKKIAKEAINIGWQTLRVYAAAKGGIILPKDPPK